MHCSAVCGSCVQVCVFLFLTKHSEHLSGASSASMPAASGIAAATHTHQNHVPALSCFFIPLSHQEQEFAAHFNLEKELANEAGKALMKRFKNGFSNCKSMQNNCFISFHFTSWSHLGRFMDFTLLQARIFRCYVFARSSMFVMRGGEQLVPGRTLAFLLRTAFRGLSCNITKSRV